MVKTSVYGLVVVLLICPITGRAADLAKSLQEYNVIKRQHSLDRAVITAWIGRLETELAESAINDPLRLAVTSELADLYVGAGSRQLAHELYLRLGKSVDAAPDLRLQACLNDVQVLLAMGSDGEAGVLAALDRFEQILVETNNEVTPAERRPSHFNRWFGFQLDRQRAEIIVAASRRRVADLRSRGRAKEANLVLLADLQRSADLLNAYTARIHADPAYGDYKEKLEFLNFGVGPTLFTRSSLLDEAAKAAAECDDPALAKNLRAKAIDGLNQFFSVGTSGSFSQPAAVLLLKQMQEMKQPLPDLRIKAESLIGSLPVGHEMLTFLRGRGVELSNTPDNLIEANKLCQLVTAAERKWFPDEFGDHVNYQWALLQIGVNQVRLGDLSGAATTIDLLKDVTLQGDALRQIFVRLTEQYNYAFREEIAIRPMAKDVPTTRQVSVIDAKASAVGAVISSKAENDKSGRTGAVSATTTFVLLGCLIALVLLVISCSYVMKRCRRE